MSYALTGFDDKVAVVTGAGRMRSIGRPIALALARAGCDLVLTGSGKPASAYPEDERAAGWRDIESVADEVRALGRRALALVSDVRDPQAVEALAARVMAEWDRVDIVVNNAGSTRGSDRVPATELPLAEWQRVLGTNLDGTFYMSRCFARHMAKSSRGGAIVNISSIAGRNRMPNTAAYATSKAAIDALSTVLAGELGPQGDPRQRGGAGHDRHQPHGRRAARRGVGPHRASADPARPRRQRRGHRAHCGVPVQRASGVDHRADLLRRRWTWACAALLREREQCTLSRGAAWQRRPSVVAGHRTHGLSHLAVVRAHGGRHHHRPLSGVPLT